jgi:hypothetical protein
MTNGRSANLLAALSMGLLPHWLVSVLCGLATGGMYLLMLYFCRFFPSKNRGTAATVCLCFIAFLFPWWDGFSLIDVSFNYVWAIAMPLAVIFMLKYADSPRLNRHITSRKTTSDKLKAVAIGIFCILAGMAHEASTLPMCVGMLWVAYVNGTASKSGWKWLSKAQRFILTYFLLGVALVVFSPGILMRATSDKVPDDTWWLLVVKSAPITLLLIAVIAVAMLSAGGRKRVLTMLHGTWGFWAISAITGIFIVAIGGIVGRSGWFSQSCALIALVQWLQPAIERRHINPCVGGALATALGALAVAQMVGVDIYSYRGWVKDTELRKMYAASTDGIVYYDMPDGCDLPLWAFSRVRYLQPTDDYTHYALRTYYEKEYSLINLPAKAATIDWENFEPATKIYFDRGYITGQLPDGAVMPSSDKWYRPYIGRDVANRNFIIPFEKSGRTFYYVTPYRFYWGDR